MLCDVCSFRESGIGEISILDSRLRGIVPVSEVKCTEAELQKLTGAGNEGVWSRTDYLGILAVQEAIESAGINNISELLPTKV